MSSLPNWAQERNRGLNELAQAWLLAQPNICSVISGATKLEHLRRNVEAAGWKLTTEELEEINKILDTEGDES